MVSVYNSCESRSKNLVAFTCLPRFLNKLSSLSGCPSPNTGGGVPSRRGKETTFQRLSAKPLEWADRNLQAFQRSPALLTCPGSCPLKERNLNLVNHCSFRAENPFKARSPKARMSQQSSEISRTPIVKENNRPAPFLLAKSMLIAGQAKL